MKKSEPKRIKNKANAEYKKVKKPVFTMEELPEEKTAELIPTIFDVPLKEELKVDIENVGKIKVITGSAMRTPEFDEKYYFHGELGPIYSREKTVLRLWAPTAINVEAVIYHDLTPNSEVNEVIPMIELDKGIWEVSLDGDMKNKAYTYRLTFSDGLVNTACDPYSKAVTANGGRTVIIDPEDAVIEDFERMPSFSSPVDAVIYEVHIRDFSISPDSGIKNKGKYSGMVETGTTYKEMPTGLDYIKELGITHLQLLPMFDFASVDELAEHPNYNWGYDPLNFNVPEGSYSTDPRNPLRRIIELKSMIKKLHENGIRVIMDVVYNHVFDVKLQNLHLTVPGYYFRYNDKGELSNGTGVGNDTASERKMMKKYILDSIIYWTKEFNLDGFRFDLMGIHDVELMNNIRTELDRIDPSIIILGEGWKLDTPIPETMKANQWNTGKMPGIAHFNDSVRDIVKGSVFLDKEKGFISGKHVENLLYLNMSGAYNMPSKIPSFPSPDRVVQYVEAHDNYTMYDKLIKVDPNDPESKLIRRHALGTAIVLLSQGIPFLHGGQEFLRTKYGVENSYKSEDIINRYDWSRAYKYREAVNYISDLIKLRKEHKLFRLGSVKEITESISLLHAGRGILAFRLKNEEEEITVILNSNEKTRNVDIGSGTYETLYEDLKVYKDGKNIVSTKGKIKMSPLSVTVLKRVG